MSLSSKMTALANAIRSKSGKTNKMGIDAMTEAVNGISVGVTVQRKTGTVRTDKNGDATVNCGFKPDVVAFEAEGHLYPVFSGLMFAEANETTLEMYTRPADTANYFVSALSVNITETGFSIIDATKISYSIEQAVDSYRTFTYTALKYT